MPLLPAKAPRLLLQADLRPVQGDRFQPTGFADLGPATFQRPDGTRMLLVESAQSVANRMELCLLGADSQLHGDFAGLPYVQVQFTGASKSSTNSLIEAHRLNSPFIISDPGFQQAFKSRSGYAKAAPLDWQKIAAAVFHFDPNTLLHGVFLANLEDGRVKIPRLLSGFIEASGVQEVVSGGVKNNPIDPTGKLRAKGYDKNVYSNVPYQRVEFTAKQVTAFFNFDLHMLRSYALPEAANDLLLALGLLKVRRFLNIGLRLRTACDFAVCGELSVTAPGGFTLPGENELMATIKTSIQACASSGLFANPSVTQITTETVMAASKDDAPSSEEVAENED